jgi:hypothetical protein
LHSKKEENNAKELVEYTGRRYGKSFHQDVLFTNRIKEMDVGKRICFSTPEKDIILEVVRIIGPEERRTTYER